MNAPACQKPAISIHGSTRARPQPGTTSHPPQLVSTSRRAALLSTVATLTSMSTMSPSHGVSQGPPTKTTFEPTHSSATGLESVDLTQLKLPEAAEKAIAERAAAQQQRLADAESRFQESELLSSLRQRSEENRAKNKQDLQTKYCFRQAELGIGDCGGLRLVPQYRDQFVAKRPGWLDALVGGGGSKE